MKNGAFKIESGIPLPPRHKGYTEAMRKLKVGQSILFDAPINAINPVAHRYFGSGRYACRITKDGTRVWRLK